MNDHVFDDGFVRGVYEACVEAGVDYMEVGYKASKKLFARDKFGTWKFCEEDDIRRIVGENKQQFEALGDGRCRQVGLADRRVAEEQSVLDMIRVAFYANQVSEAVEMIKDAFDKGYEVSANLMAVSTAHEAEVDQVLEVVAETPANVLVVVDSYGAMYAEQVELLVKKYLAYGKATGKEVGMHAHNNQQLAFANTIEAIIHGANRVDGVNGRHRSRRRQLPDGTVDRLLAQSEVQDPRDLQGACRITYCRSAAPSSGAPTCSTTSPAN